MSLSNTTVSVFFEEKTQQLITAHCKTICFSTSIAAEHQQNVLLPSPPSPLCPTSVPSVVKNCSTFGHPINHRGKGGRHRGEGGIEGYTIQKKAILLRIALP